MGFGLEIVFLVWSLPLAQCLLREFGVCFGLVWVVSVAEAVAGGMLEAVQTSLWSCTAMSVSEYECSDLGATRKKSGINNNEKKRDQHLMWWQFLFASQVNVSEGHQGVSMATKGGGWLCWVSVACWVEPQAANCDMTWLGLSYWLKLIVFISHSLQKSAKCRKKKSVESRKNKDQESLSGIFPIKKLKLFSTQKSVVSLISRESYLSFLLGMFLLCNVFFFLIYFFKELGFVRNLT